MTEHPPKLSRAPKTVLVTDHPSINIFMELPV
jgi:hypothetical protein